MQPNEKTTRNEDIVTRYLAGESLSALGRALGLSRQRVDQIVGRHITRPKREWDPQNFFTRIEKRDSGCWEYNGPKTKGGYGIYYHRGGVLAHRFSYEMHKGVIPDGFHVDHLCFNKTCVNPEHLEAVTPQENSARAYRAGRYRTSNGKCTKGHELREETTYKCGNGKRRCKVCVSIYQKEWKRRRVI